MEKWISVNGRLMPATRAAALAAEAHKARTEREERAAMTPRGTVNRDGSVSVSRQDLYTPSQQRQIFEALDRKALFVEDGVTVLDEAGMPVDVGG